MLNKTLCLENLLFQEVATVKKNCLYISNRENKAVTRQKELYQLSKLISDMPNNLYFEVVDSSTCNWIDYALYIDYGFICSYVHRYSDSFEVGRFTDIISNWTKNNMLEYEYQKGYILGNAISGQFVNVQEIELLKLAGEDQETVNILIDARQAYINNREKEEHKKQKEREEKEKQALSDKQKEYNEALAEAEEKLLNKQQLDNETIRVYSSSYSYDEKSIVLELCKKHDIKVPLKTQGWINNALANIRYAEDRKGYTYSYYSTSKNSTVFEKYMNMLILAIQKTYNKVDTGLENKLQELERKEESTEKIDTLKWNEIQGYREQVEMNMFRRNDFVVIKEEKIIEIAKVAYKALNSKMIDHHVENWIMYHDICDDEKSCYNFVLNGNEVTVYPRMIKGNLKYLWIKNTKKSYYSYS